MLQAQGLRDNRVLWLANVPVILCCAEDPSGYLMYCAEHKGISETRIARAISDESCHRVSSSRSFG